ncbi:hypothetical protein ED733_000648 [Metarhizium rileyi]|uniref:Uncharacterized protein n=1 Tax=Metarhizium rileyi (strain RCEF 4871) TaxID=1649241 RepID=A0A5C6GKE4_METRR|nr:hypothetical protein ED733_000648 [Metarhizium rileyi]
MSSGSLSHLVQIPTALPLAIPRTFSRRTPPEADCQFYIHDDFSLAAKVSADSPSAPAIYTVNSFGSPGDKGGDKTIRGSWFGLLDRGPMELHDQLVSAMRQRSMECGDELRCGNSLFSVWLVR